MNAMTITVDSGNSNSGYARTVLVRSGRGYRVIESTHTLAQQEDIKRQLRAGETALSIETRKGSCDYVDGRVTHRPPVPGNDMVLGRTGQRKVCADCGRKRATRQVYIGMIGVPPTVWYCLACYDANGVC